MKTLKNILSLLVVIFITSQTSLLFSQVIKEANRNDTVRNDTICDLIFKYQNNDTIIYKLNPRCEKYRFPFPDIQNAVILAYSTEDSTELLFSTKIKNGKFIEKEYRKFNDYEFQNIIWNKKGKITHMFSSVIKPTYSFGNYTYDNVIGTTLVYNESHCLIKIIYKEKRTKKIISLNCDGMIENVDILKIKK